MSTDSGVNREATDYAVTKRQPDERDRGGVGAEPDHERPVCQGSQADHRPSVVSLAVVQVGGTGFTLDSCVEDASSCTPTEIAPAGTGTVGTPLYQAGPVPGSNNNPAAGPPLMGVLFDEKAMNEPLSSLPLTWTDDADPRKVATRDVTVTNTATRSRSPTRAASRAATAPSSCPSSVGACLPWLGEQFLTSDRCGRGVPVVAE